MKLRTLLFALLAPLAAGCAASPDPTPTPGAVTLRGTVRDHRGFAVGGLSLIATSLEGGSAHSGYTDPRGVYSMAGLPPGTYRVVLLQGERIAGRSKIVIRDTPLLDLHFELQAARPRDPLGPITDIELGSRSPPSSPRDVTASAAK